MKELWIGVNQGVRIIDGLTINPFRFADDIAFSVSWRRLAKHPN